MTIRVTGSTWAAALDVPEQHALLAHLPSPTYETRGKGRTYTYHDVSFQTAVDVHTYLATLAARLVYDVDPLHGPERRRAGRGVMADADRLAKDIVEAMVTGTPPRSPLDQAT